MSIRPVSFGGNAVPPSAQRGFVARRTARTAFTLLEVLISLGLMIGMLAGVFTFYMTVLKANDAGTRASRDALVANALLRRIAEEIRHACDIVPGDGLGFSGTHDQIVIVRTKLPEGYAFEKHDGITDQFPPGQQDIARITYELVWDDELKDDEGVKVCHGLLRSEQRTFDPNPTFVVKASDSSSNGLGAAQDDGTDAQNKNTGVVIPVDRELVAPEIKYVRFEYFDGAKWMDKWQNQQQQSGDDLTGLSGGDHALPQAVRVTLGHVRVAPEEETLNLDQLKKMSDEEKRKEFHPDRFTIVVYLEQADQSMLSSRGFAAKNDPDLQTGGAQ